MRNPGYFFLLGFCLVIALMLPGCGLLGPSVEKAREVAEARQEAADKAAADLLKAASDLEELVAAYEAAIADGDTTKAEAAKQAVMQAIARYESAKDVAASSRALFEAASEDFAKAESASDYVGTVFGWITAGLGALFGGGALVGRSRAREALAGTTAALEKTKADPTKWPDAKHDMQSSLSTGALKLIDKLRP